jgi:hypothetical protein
MAHQSLTNRSTKSGIRGLAARRRQKIVPQQRRKAAPEGFFLDRSPREEKQPPSTMSVYGRNGTSARANFTRELTSASSKLGFGVALGCGMEEPSLSQGGSDEQKVSRSLVGCGA